MQNVVEERRKSRGRRASSVFGVRVSSRKNLWKIVYLVALVNLFLLWLLLRRTSTFSASLAEVFDQPNHGDNFSDPLQLVVIIWSSVDDFQPRTLLRHSWLTDSYLDETQVTAELQWRFFVFLSNPAPASVLEEMAEFGDMVLIYTGNSSSHNLPVPFVTEILIWVEKSLPAIDFVMIADPSAFVRIDSIVNVLAKYLLPLRIHGQQVYLGRIESNHSPDLFVPWEDYPFPWYFPYATPGVPFILSGPLAFLVLRELTLSCASLPHPTLGHVSIGLVIEVLRRKGVTVDIEQLPSIVLSSALSASGWNKTLSNNLTVLQGVDLNSMPFLFYHIVVRDEYIPECPIDYIPGGFKTSYLPENFHGLSQDYSQFRGNILFAPLKLGEFSLPLLEWSQVCWRHVSISNSSQSLVEKRLVQESELPKKPSTSQPKKPKPKPSLQKIVSKAHFAEESFSMQGTKETTSSAPSFRRCCPDYCYTLDPFHRKMSINRYILQYFQSDLAEMN